MFETCCLCVFLFLFVGKQVIVKAVAGYLGVPSLILLESREKPESPQQRDFSNISQETNKVIFRHGDGLGGMTFISR